MLVIYAEIMKIYLEHIYLKSNLQRFYKLNKNLLNNCEVNLQILNSFFFTLDGPVDQRTCVWNKYANLENFFTKCISDQNQKQTFQDHFFLGNCFLFV